jgi:hypothetical protein
MATAKELRPVLQAALRTGFTERGWTPPRRGAGVFTRPVEGTELVVEWDTEAEGYRYGGMQFGGVGRITSPEISADLLTYPDAVWTERLRETRSERVHWLSFESETAGGLTDPRGNHRTWTAQTAEEVTTTVAEFFEMVDGPLARWLRSVTPVGTLLDAVIWGRGPGLLNESRAELFALLAVRHDRPGIARAVLRLARRDSKEPEVLDAFERELTSRHPEPLKRLALPVAEHPLWRPVADALWTGFHARGWAPSASLSGTFETAPDADGLVVQWTPEVELEGGGGLRFGGFGVLTAPAAVEELLRFPPESRPRVFDDRDDDEARAMAWLEVVTAGRLVDPEGDEPLWTVRSPEDAATATEEFFAMVGGPLARRLAPTGTLEAQLRLGSEPPQQLRGSPVRYELLVLLAVAHGRTESARSIVRTGLRHYPGPFGRFGRFDNEIAARYPGYGAPQVHNGPGGFWLIGADGRPAPWR